ncbi:MAG: hypothetical protein AB2L07_19135 [Thermoanaerobaculaceae bacterium]
MAVSELLLRALRADTPWLDGRSLADWFARFLPARVVPTRRLPDAQERVCLVVGPRQAGESARSSIWLPHRQATS